jgi:hypothetical protein
MKKSPLLRGLLLWSMSLALFGQYHVTGQIIDSESGEGIHGASVFIAGTTAGTATFTGGYCG